MDTLELNNYDDWKYKFTREVLRLQKNESMSLSIETNLYEEKKGKIMENSELEIVDQKK